MSEIERLHQQRMEREKAKPKNEPDPTEWRPRDNSEWEWVDCNVRAEQMRSQPMRYQSLAQHSPEVIASIEATGRAELIQAMERQGLFPDERGVRVHWAMVVEGNGFRMPDGFVHPEAPVDVHRRGREAWKRCVEMASDSLSKFIFVKRWVPKPRRLEGAEDYPKELPPGSPDARPTRVSDGPMIES